MSERLDKGVQVISSSLKLHRCVTGLMTLVGTFSMLLVFEASPAASITRQDRPNVLIILTDDQRADEDAYRVMPKTMSIFRNAGTQHSNAVATTPLCCPSRASIFSGQYAHNHGVRNNHQVSNFDARHSMQYELQNNGYQTAITGKYLNGFRDNPPYFDQWAVIHRGNTYYDTPVTVNGRLRTVKSYLTNWIKRKSIDFLQDFETREHEPWFLVVATKAPHFPAIPAKKYLRTNYPPFKGNPATRERNLRDKPKYVQSSSKSKERVKRFRRKQLLALKSVDDLTGDLFAALEDLKETNTLTIFLSDNGIMWFEHSLAGKGHAYDGSVRIPLFVHWPGHVPAGESKLEISANIDVAPTVFDAAGIAPAYPVDGRSLFTTDGRDSILLEYVRDTGSDAVPTWRGLWTPQWKYFVYETGEKEYYESDDIWELRNVYGNEEEGDEPANEAQLDALLTAYSSCRGQTCP